MFGLEFLFAAALWALPLAGLPVLLHLLFRQKSPVVQFSTLRFVKLSMQATAARRRVRKWLLLACRALLLALLIWAVAQPAKKLAGAWLGGGGGAAGRSVIVAVVVDCSYSMQLEEAQLPLLVRADAIVQDLLRTQFAGAKVAVFQSQPSTDQPETLRDAWAILSQWSPLQPQANPKPLVDRVTAAMALLDLQPAEQKWLVVLSDFQANEFGRPLGELKDGRIVLIDLHPLEPHSAGVTRISIAPAQPIPGVASEVLVQVTGRPGESRAVALKATSLTGATVIQTAPAMANLDAGGRATVRFPIKLPADRYLLLTGAFSADDAALWDNQRSQLLELPSKQRVTLLSTGPVARFIKLALDPGEGKIDQWPIDVTNATTLDGAAHAAVAILTQWPDLRSATMLRDLARSGHSVVLFLQPGLETSWEALPPETKNALAELLPSAPLNRASTGTARATIADARSPLLEGLTDERFQLSAISARRIVPFTAQPPARTILNAAPVDPAAGSRLQGLLFQKPVGSGVCFTIATTPDRRYTNLATHPVFLPILVRMALPAPQQSGVDNVELGQPLVLQRPGAASPAVAELQIATPQHEQYRVKAEGASDGRRFVFTQVRTPGLYKWQNVGDPSTLALTNVQLPASESELTYRPASTLAPGAVVVTGLSELQGKLAALSEPQPRWSMPIAIVLVLICLEAAIGAGSGWRRVTPPVIRE